MSAIAPIVPYVMTVISIGAAGFGLVGIAWTIAEAQEGRRE